MEIEHHHLALEVAQTAHLTMVVGQCNIDKSRGRYLAGIDGIGTVCLVDAHILHALDGNVVQVGSALSSWMVGIPTGSYRCKHFDVIFVAARVKQQHVAQGLEQCKICIRAVGLFENIVHLYIILIVVDDA